MVLMCFFLGRIEIFKEVEQIKVKDCILRLITEQRGGLYFIFINVEKTVWSPL